MSTYKKKSLLTQGCFWLQTSAICAITLFMSPAFASTEETSFESEVKTTEIAKENSIDTNVPVKEVAINEIQINDTTSKETLTPEDAREKEEKKDIATDSTEPTPSEETDADSTIALA